MHYFGAKTLTVATSSLLLLSLSFLASADPAVLSDRRPRQAKPVTLSEPYRLTLSLSEYRSESPDAPYFTLNIANATRNHSLLFIWRSVQDVVYKVEYKSPTDNPYFSTGWKKLRPIIKAVPSPSRDKPAGDDGLTQSGDYGMRFIIEPGRTSNELAFPPDVPLFKQGFYRVTAVVTVPDAREFDDSLSQDPLLRVFTLIIRSEPFVIRRTVDGFVTVNPDTVKKAVPMPK